jgi:hypothetical protein
VLQNCHSRAGAPPPKPPDRKTIRQKKSSHFAEYTAVASSTTQIAGVTGDRQPMRGDYIGFLIVGPRRLKETREVLHREKPRCRSDSHLRPLAISTAPMRWVSTTDRLMQIIALAPSVRG